MRSEDKHYTTKPRGNFRHTDTKPLVGDVITFEYDLNKPEQHGRILSVQPRRNQLIRPSVVNVDSAFVVMSLVEPDFSYSLLDQFLVSVELHHIEPIILLTKYDLAKAANVTRAEELVLEICHMYEAIGYAVHVLDGSTKALDTLKTYISEGLYVVMGQSGVGKSTLLNRLIPELTLETGEISQYLNRGRHTTREVTLYEFGKGLLADTPGFSALDFDDIEKETLGHYFPEIVRASAQCKYRSCVHLNEPDCAVKQFVDSHVIADTRYQNYRLMYEKIANRKPVYHRKKK